MTNTNIEIFNSEEFGSVRVLTISGEPWFVGRDVAAALGYANTKDALGKHVDAEDKRIIQRSQNATFEIPVRGLTIINESGLYSLMLLSKLPDAKRFKRWITAEVLPTIRKNGFYITDPLLQQFARDPDFAHAVVDALYEQTERVNRLLPKADYFDAFVDPGDAVPIRIAAKQLGVSEHWLVRMLVGCHIRGAGRERPRGRLHTRRQPHCLVVLWPPCRAGGARSLRRKARQVAARGSAHPAGTVENNRHAGQAPAV